MGFLKHLFGGGHHRGGGYGGGGHHGGGHHGYNYGNQGIGLPPGGGGINCPSCRALNTNGARFCQQCGGSMVPASCKKCDAVMVAGAKFCAQCGNSSG